MVDQEQRSPLQLFSIKGASDAIASQGEQKSILFRNGLEDHKVAVISISGRFREGKSSLMNYFTRYLRSHGSPNGIADGKSKNELGWGTSRNPITNGVQLYPEDPKVKSRHGENMAVLSIDSQGTFDTETTVADNSSVFAFSMLLSSRQIFNMMISGYDLTSLERFSQCANVLASADESSAHMIVRDWAHAEELAIGRGGGTPPLNKRLLSVKQDDELNRIRNIIKECFDSFRCLLIPCPGEHVIHSTTVTDSVKDILPEFLCHLTDFFNSLLIYFQPKGINGSDITLSQFTNFLELFQKAIKSDQILKPETLLQTVMKLSMSALRKQCTERYCSTFEEQANHEPLEKQQFREVHDRTVNELRALFKERVKLDPLNEWNELEEELKKFFEEKYLHYLELNQIRLSKKASKKQMEESQRLARELEENANVQKEEPERIEKEIQQKQNETLALQDSNEIAKNEAQAAEEAKTQEPGVFKQFYNRLTWNPFSILWVMRRNN